MHKAIPSEWRAAHHWFNVGVETDTTGDQNPLHQILEVGPFGPADFVVVKLDIDTPSVENPMAKQLLSNPRLAELVDVFHHEHHVGVAEMQPHWKRKTDGSMIESLEHFTRLRELRIASHHWV